MIKVLVHLALGIDGRNVMGETPLRHGFAIDHSYNAIDSDLRGNLWPIERADEGLRQSETRGFDHDVIWLVIACEQFFHGGHEIICDGAADTAIGELHYVVLCAGFIAASFEDISIHTEIAEFIYDKRNALAFGIFEHVTD